MFDKSQIASVIGQSLYAEDGTKIGKIGQVYVDEVHDQPEWVTVNTGLFGKNESFVPLAEASMTDGGLRVPYTKDAIKDAPNVSAEQHLSEAEERKLYEHYGVPYTTEGSTFADVSRLGNRAGTAASGTRQPYSDEQYGNTTDRPAYDDGDRSDQGSMTRSEERVNVGTEQVQAGRARLHKWVETETQQVEVPIRTEKARLVSEPITDTNRGDAFDGPAISEAEHEVVLNTERPVVNVEAVPVERVRLDKTVEESSQTVEQDVRKERISLDDDTTTGTTGRKRR
ncbi:PRC and DUF2382 domain-containing protein [Kineosporia mesophila]|uniref:PRC and DUF2382 domain-containing protein n=2 Tax=Kineosporia mesophila TaxID=566012 RepID=A0ABP6ZB12_9ACTN|nr:PRC and DUF2382 domain-containing protein [Kineosporia mesophila]